MSDATITVAPGTVIGTFGAKTSAYALGIGSGAELICEGSAANLAHVVACNTVQEQPGSGWQAPPRWLPLPMPLAGLAAHANLG